MKVSIITTVFNNVNTIEDTIESVLSQTYADIEYIIVDGASTDGTLDIVNHYRERISVISSKKDKGIYDGFNRGVKLASGEIIGFLNSDDYYPNENVIDKIVQGFNRNENIKSVYGDLNYISNSDPSKIVRYWKSGDFTFGKLMHGWMPPHPTFFVKRSCYEKYGKFDLDYKISADYDTVLRFLGKHQITTSYIPEVLVHMRTGGASNASLKNIIQKTKEDYKAVQRNKFGSKKTVLYKNLIKIPQFIFKKASDRHV